MWLIGYPGREILEDRPDDAPIDVTTYREQWPGCSLVKFDGAYADLDRYGSEPSPADLVMAGGHDMRPYAMPVLSGAVLSGAVKAECSRRILARVPMAAQMNMAAALPDADTKTAASIRSVRRWIDGMRSTSRALTAATDADYAADGKWPAWDASWSATVSAF